MDQYISLTLARDVADLANLRRASGLPDVLARAAGQTAQIVNMASIARVTGLAESTVREYLSLLEAVFLIRELPAWGKTLIARSTGRPKIHMVDSGLAARLLRLSAEKLSQLDPTSLTEFGHLVETFAVGELLKEASWTDGISGVGHWHTQDGNEVDMVLEDDDGGIIGIEIKAGAQVPSGGFRPLERLREAVGDAFRVGITLYLGKQAYRHGDRLLALPLDRLWT
jgi:predicted AAA+ superfamily ATPase